MTPRQYLENRYKELLVAIQIDYSLAKQAEMNATMALLSVMKNIVTKVMIVKVLLMYPIATIKGLLKRDKKPTEETTAEVVQPPQA